MELTFLLDSIGLSDRETKIYLAVLEIGTASATAIARKAAVPRTTIYYLLESLIVKGLVFQKEIQGKRYYHAADPRRLKQIIAQKEKALDKAMPGLLALYKPGKEKPSVQFFEGKDEVRAIYDSFAKESEVLGFGSFDKIREYVPDFDHHIQKHLALPIKIRDLTYRSAVNEKLKELYIAPRHQLRFLPERIRIDSDNLIFRNKVAMISYGETVHGLVIESKAIANTQRSLFEYLWELSSE